ncbi:MAG: hypothetical protein EAZ47_10170 [Bacteroidetes bacterium]|nr:MAG: hypothetical protein EAY72_03675 [Bacteroidota bacterium]TAE69186.1 MAG: hypothetical protein EAY68_03895 [Bacteroidota bacterium]TAF91262.1 MAG: hypothetical protein EAZ47_10170 [Bacteroidota bacterium]
MKKQMVTLVALVSMLSVQANVVPNTAELIKTPQTSNIRFVQKNELGNYFTVTLHSNAPTQGKFSIYNQNGEVIYTCNYRNNTLQKTILLTADVDLNDTLTLQFEEGKKRITQVLDAVKLIPQTQVIVGNIWEDEE